MKFLSCLSTLENSNPEQQPGAVYGADARLELGWVEAREYFDPY